jgi:ketosteroid isomerase-like protein
MKKVIIFFVILSASNYCSYSQLTTKIDKEKIKSEISLVEQNFQKDLVTSGVDFAFHKYAAENAVIKREKDTLVIGKQAIKIYYSNPIYKNAVAEWSPDFIDVSDDGTMAYTYGKYRWNFKDKQGKVTKYEGIFHTVWKRMADASWKYVWD